MISKAPRKHGGAVPFDECRRVDGRLQERLAGRCVDRLLAVRDDQHDLSRSHAAIVGEELPRGFEAVRDRRLAVRHHLVDSSVDLGLAGRPCHASRRICCEGHHGEARRVQTEVVLAHQLLGQGLQPAGTLHRAFGKGLLHRAALIEHQNEVNRSRAGRLGRGGRRRGRRQRRRRGRGRRRRGGRRGRGRRRRRRQPLRIHTGCQEHWQPLRRNGAALRRANLGGHAWVGRGPRVDGAGVRGVSTHAALRAMEEA